MNSFFSQHKRFLLIGSFSLPCQGFESAQVLPPGISSVTMSQVSFSSHEKTNHIGEIELLGQSMAQPLPIKSFVRTQKGFDRTLLESFLIANQYDLNDEIGFLSSLTKVRINPTISIFSYGLTAKTSFAIVLPFYHVKTDTQIALSFHDNARRLISQLSFPDNNQVTAARSAVTALNQPIIEFNKLLKAHHYLPLEQWKHKGLGDIQFAVKHLLINSPIFRSSFTSGLVAPTGRTDDPNNLADIPLGDGQWDLYGSISWDFLTNKSLFFNYTSKYTYQAPSRKTVRMKTSNNKIAVPNESVRWKLGDKFENNLSIQYSSIISGIKAGLGTVFKGKFSDQYFIHHHDSRSELEKDTSQRGLFTEAMIGYTTISNYQDTSLKIPLSLTLKIQKHIQSKNTVIGDLSSLGVSFFF